MRFLKKVVQSSRTTKGWRRLRLKCLTTARNSNLSNRKAVSNFPRSGTKWWLRLTEPNVWHLKRALSHRKTTTILITQSTTIKSSRSQMAPHSKHFPSNSSSSNNVFKKMRRRIATLSLPTMTTIRVSRTSPRTTSRNLHRSISLSQTTSLVFLSKSSRKKSLAGLNLTAKVLTIMSVLMTNNFLKITTSKKEMILMEMLE